MMSLAILPLRICLLHLSNDELFSVFERLELRDLHAVMATCNRFSNVVRGMPAVGLELSYVSSATTWPVSMARSPLARRHIHVLRVRQLLSETADLAAILPALTELRVIDQESEFPLPS